MECTLICNNMSNNKDANITNPEHCFASKISKSCCKTTMKNIKLQQNLFQKHNESFSNGLNTLESD